MDASSSESSNNRRLQYINKEVNLIAQECSETNTKYRVSSQALDSLSALSLSVCTRLRSSSSSRLKLLTSAFIRILSKNDIERVIYRRVLSHEIVLLCYSPVSNCLTESRTASAEVSSSLQARLVSSKRRSASLQVGICKNQIPLKNSYIFLQDIYNN